MQQFSALYALPTPVEQLAYSFHQFRRAGHVPVGIGHVAMAEIRGQDRQTPTNVITCPVPVQQRLHSEPVPEIMQARSAAGGRAANTYLSGKRVENTTDLPWVETTVALRAKEVRALPPYKHAVPLFVIVAESFHRRSMERHQT